MGSINLGSNGTITNLAVGGLPDGSVDKGSLASNFDDELKSDIALLGFYRASDNSKTKYNLTDQVIDEFTDSTGIDASASTNEYLESGAVSGQSGNNYPTGGTVTTHGSYRVHSFLSTGNTNFVVPSAGTVDMLVVGGGGGGGSYGGGGAGGVRSKTGHSVTAQTYVVTVGAGATGTVSSGQDNQGDSGAASSFDSFEAAGGGGGGGSSYVPALTGLNGGSGGGTGSDIPSGTANTGGLGNTPSTSPSQGNNGGLGQATGTAHPDYTGGGGGGAGGVGGNASTTGTATGGAGGAGIPNDFRTGSNVYYGGGGGGQGNEHQTSNGVGGAGGTGGGGKGNSYGADDAANGTANTGGGGGGGDEGTDNGGAKTSGGSGIVVIRYATTQFPGIGDLTLVSNAQTASSAPSTADFHVLIENAAGTATINTDIKAYVSRDNGSNWTEIALADEGTWGTNRKVLAAHDKTITSTSGTSVRYKVTTHNQANGSKETKIHATSLGWK